MPFKLFHFFYSLYSNSIEELDKIENYIEQALYYSKIDYFSKDYLINEIELNKLIKEAVKKQKLGIYK
jgi:hypothetical protein